VKLRHDQLDTYNDDFGHLVRTIPIRKMEGTSHGDQ
jgi:hypothetical protein